MTPSQFAAIYNQKRVPGYYTQSGGAGNVPVFTSNPSILSTPTVGSPTAYLSGTYTGTPPITVTQQWNLNGTPVGGATYTPVSGDVGKTLTVVEAIQNAYGGPVYATSAGATVVAAGTNPNPIGTNFAAGGSASLSYEGFPIFQDRIREARMFSAVTIPSANITANGTTSITLYNIQGTPAIGQSLNGAYIPYGTILVSGSGTSWVTNNPVPVSAIFSYMGSPLSGAGWPTTDFSVLLNESAGSQTWMQQSASYSAGTSFSCGFISNGTGTETITGLYSSSINNIVRVGTTVTFDLQVGLANSLFGFQITGTTGGVTNVFARLPGYRTGGYSSTSQFTTEAINVYKQFAHIRWMFFQNAWGNGALNTSATRNTPANTKTNKFWGEKEGYPIEWAMDFCNACSIGGWFHIPTNEDGTYSSAVATLLAANMPAGKPIYIEIGNELWNGSNAQTVLRVLSDAATAASFTGTISGTTLTVTGVTGAIHAPVNGVPISGAGVTTNTLINAQLTGTPGGAGTYNVTISQTVGPIAMTAGYEKNVNGAYCYLGVLLHNLATTFRAAFGVRYNTDLRLVLAGQIGAGLMAQTMLYMTYRGWTPSADLWAVAQAPYVDTTYGNSGSVAAIESNITTIAATNCQSKNAEMGLAIAKFYGLAGGSISYEGGWETNNANSTNPNVTTAIMDSGMTAAMNAHHNNVFNSGFTVYTNFESGVGTSTFGANTLCPVDELSNNWATLTSTGSPRLASLLNYTAGTYVPTRNAINGSGSVVTGTEWLDNTVSLNSTPAYIGIANYYANGARAGTGNFLTYLLNVNTAGTYTLVITTTGTVAYTTNVEVDGTVLYTGTTISNTSGVASNFTIGSITLTKGPHYVMFGTVGGGSLSSAVFNSLTFN